MTEQIFQLKPVKVYQVDIVFDDIDFGEKTRTYFEKKGIKEGIRSVKGKKRTHIQYQLTMELEEESLNRLILPNLQKLMANKYFVLFCLTDLSKVKTGAT